MATVTVDTLAAVHRLRDAGYDEQQAEVIVRVIGDAQDQLVTREHFDAKIGLVEARINLVQWMNGFILAFLVAIFVKLFIH